MNNYLVAPKLYNTGFINPKANELRIKQGLAPQDVSNACDYNTFSELDKYQGTQPNEIHQKRLYPAKQTQLDYGLPQIPDNCPCLDYIVNNY
jgi:hypothetical protein